MKNSPFAKKPNSYPRSFPFADFRSEVNKQCRDLPPFYITHRWAMKYKFKSFLGLSIHDLTVPHISTISKGALENFKSIPAERGNPPDLLR